ncbi:MAG: ABC transporter substrate-binding protein [Bacteroidota bacterium]
MIRACSFLPAATQMIYDLGLQDQLHGVTFECSVEARKAKPVAVRYLLEGKQYSSAEIDRIFSTSKAQGKSLYYIDQEVLQAASPDVIFTQDICEVCQIDVSCAAAAVAMLATSPALVSITPQSLNDVFNTLITIGQALGAEAVAYRHLAQLRSQLDTIVDQLRTHRATPRRVMLLEWMDPIYNCGHWIPDQIAYAGGTDLLAHPGGDSIVTSWDKIVRYDPEVLVIAPCGFTIKRSLEEMWCMTQQPGWSTMKAVRDQKVFIAEYDLFTQSSAANLVDGIELLAALFHPAIFSVPTHLQDKCQPLPQPSFTAK